MKKLLLLAAPLLLAQAPPPSLVNTSADDIAANAPGAHWLDINPDHIMVMDSAAGRMVIQLAPQFAPQHVAAIQKLVRAGRFDDGRIVRVQDNYVVQWGDATEKKALPEALATMEAKDYVTPDWPSKDWIFARADGRPDAYAGAHGFYIGWPLAQGREGLWPIHCYGMVGVGRNLAPDTGTGAELYTVIGHAPRHLDRNIALVGRVIEGIEHLSSLPRGTGALGFYEKETERVPILSVRLGDAVRDVPAFEYLDTNSASFAAYADARANRRDPFFNVPAGGADICNIPVPIRRKAK